MSSPAPAARGPAVGVGAVVVHEGRVLLIRRGKRPLEGRWVIPGGTVEWGEALEAAVAREVLEETSVVVEAREVVAVFDRIERDAGSVDYHYVIIDYRCEYVRGTPVAGSDAAGAAFVALDELDRYDVPPKALEVIAKVVGPLSPLRRDPPRR